MLQCSVTFSDRLDMRKTTDVFEFKYWYIVNLEWNRIDTQRGLETFQKTESPSLALVKDAQNRPINDTYCIVENRELLLIALKWNRMKHFRSWWNILGNVYNVTLQWIQNKSSTATRKGHFLQHKILENGFKMAKFSQRKRDIVVFMIIVLILILQSLQASTEESDDTKKTPKIVNKGRCLEIERFTK